MISCWNSLCNRRSVFPLEGWHHSYPLDRSNITCIVCCDQRKEENRKSCAEIFVLNCCPPAPLSTERGHEVTQQPHKDEAVACFLCLQTTFGDVLTNVLTNSTKLGRPAGLKVLLPLCECLCARIFQQFLWKFLRNIHCSLILPHSTLSLLWNSVGLCPSRHTLPACVSAEWWEAGSHRPHQHCLLYVTVSLLHCQTRNNKEEPQVIRQHFARGFTQSLFESKSFHCFPSFFAWLLLRWY